MKAIIDITPIAIIEESMLSVTNSGMFTSDKRELAMLHSQNIMMFCFTFNRFLIGLVLFGH